MVRGARQPSWFLVGVAAVGIILCGSVAIAADCDDTGPCTDCAGGADPYPTPATGNETAADWSTGTYCQDGSDSITVSPSESGWDFIVLDGSATFSSSTTGTVTTSAGGSASISATTISLGALDSDGTMTVPNGGTLSVSGATSIGSAGSLVVESGGTFNTGTFTMDETSTFTINGNVDIDGEFVPGGPLTVSAGTTLEVGSLTVTAGTSLTVQGTLTSDSAVGLAASAVEVANGGTLNAAINSFSTLSVPGGTINGAVTSGSGTMTVSGGANLDSVSLDGGGSFTMDGDASLASLSLATATMSMSGGTLTLGGGQQLSVGSDSTLIVADGVSTSVATGAVVVDSSNLQVGAGSTLNVPTLAVTGDNAQVNLLGADASVVSAGAVTVSGGSIVGTGSITGTTINVNVPLNPGAANAYTSGTVTLSGQVVLDEVLALQLGNLAGDGGETDVVVINGDLDVRTNGEVLLNLEPGYGGSNNIRSYTVLTVSGSVVGQTLTFRLDGISQDDCPIEAGFDESNNYVVIVPEARGCEQAALPGPGIDVIQVMYVTGVISGLLGMALICFALNRNIAPAGVDSRRTLAGDVKRMTFGGPSSGFNTPTSAKRAQVYDSPTKEVRKERRPSGNSGGGKGDKPRRRSSGGGEGRARSKSGKSKDRAKRRASRTSVASAGSGASGAEGSVASPEGEGDRGGGGRWSGIGKFLSGTSDAGKSTGDKSQGLYRLSSGSKASNASNTARRVSAGSKGSSGLTKNRRHSGGSHASRGSKGVKRHRSASKKHVKKQ